MATDDLWCVKPETIDMNGQYNELHKSELEIDVFFRDANNEFKENVEGKNLKNSLKVDCQKNENEIFDNEPSTDNLKQTDSLTSNNTGLLTFMDIDGYSNVQEIFSPDKYHWHTANTTGSTSDWIKKSTRSSSIDGSGYAQIHQFSTFGKTNQKVEGCDSAPRKKERSHSIDIGDYSQIYPVQLSRDSLGYENKYSSLPRKPVVSGYSSLPRKSNVSLDGCIEGSNVPQVHGGPGARSSSYSALNFERTSNVTTSNEIQARIVSVSPSTTTQNRNVTTWQFGQKRSSCPYKTSLINRCYNAPHVNKNLITGPDANVNASPPLKSAFRSVSSNKDITNIVPKRVSVVSFQPSSKRSSISSGQWSVSSTDGQSHVIPIDQSITKKSSSLSSLTLGFKCGIKELVKWLHVPFECCQKKKVEEAPKIKHRFRHYYFHRSRTCFLCKQKVFSQGSACQVCRYICHRQCENQVMTSCVPQVQQVNHQVKHEGVNHYQYSRDKHEGVNHYQYSRDPSFSGSTQQPANMSTLRDMIHRTHDQHPDDDHVDLDMVYITERIISMSFPSEGHETSYRYHLKDVMNMLRTKHGDNCLVLNISEPRQDLSSQNPQRVIEYGWPDHLAPPLERLCNICKSMDSWLNSDPNHVVVVHCKGGKSRLAVVVAAYMHYCSICASADQALDRFAMKRFYDDKLGGLATPSHKRYVQYFAGLLSGAIKINSSPLYLHHLVIHGVPNYDTRGGCRPFIKVYQGMQAIFTSGVYNVTDQMQKVCISISPGIPLRGDVLIKCYHKKMKTGQREVMWRCQFHTCAISGLDVTFGKMDLDDALIDPRFPDSGKVEFVFGTSQDARVLVSDFKSDVTVPVDDGTDNLVRWDSYENMANADGTINDINQNGMSPSLEMVQHTSRLISSPKQMEQFSRGPVDGNLYAMVTKRKHEQVESSILQNGTSYLQNGSSHTSSVDSGISASSTGILGSSMSPHNTNDTMQQSYNSMNTSKSSYNNSLPKQSVKPLDEQTQLDVILSDLLSDQVFVTSPQSPKSGASTLTKDSRTFRTYDSKVSPDGKTTYQSAEVTYKMPGGYREERSYNVSKTSNTDGKYVPAGAFSYTTSPELARKSESQRTNTLPYRTDYDNRYHTESSYNYRTLDGGQRSMSDNDQTSSWLQQQQNKLRQRKDSKDDRQVEQEKKLVEELRSAQNKYYTKRAQNEADEHAVMESYKMSPPPPPMANGPISPSYPGGYNTGDSKSYSQTIRTESRSYGANAANKPPPSPGQTRVILTPGGPPIIPPVRTSSKDFMQQRSRTGSTNTWQTTPQNRQLTRQLSDTTHDRDQPIVKTITITTTPPHSPRPFSPPTQQYQKSYQTSSYNYETSQQRAKDDLDFRSTLPRHSPTKTKVTEVQEMNYPEGPKKTHYITEVYVHRSAGGDRSGAGTIDRTEKKETLDRNRLDELEKSLQAAQNSIIATSPSWQQQQQRSNTSDFKEQTVTRRVETRRFETNYQQQQQQQVVSSHPDRPQDSRSMSPVWDNVNTHVNVNQVQTPSVPPKQISVVEEDRFSLRPIGPGVQPLEPEGTQTGTLGRATTPSFPVSPVASAEMLIQSVHEKVRRMSLGSRTDLHATPPFPVTPGTPYTHQHLAASSPSLSPYSPTSYGREDTYNRIVSRQLSRVSDPLYASIPEDLGGMIKAGNVSQVTSPTGTLQSQHSQFQNQQQQQQQQQYQYQTSQHEYRTQQFGTQPYGTQGSTGSHGETLQIDTSPRMLSPGSTMTRSPPSAGSPPSPGSLNTLRQQLNVAHSMSSSGGAMSPGPHSMTGQSSPSVYFGLSRRGSLSSIADSVEVHTTPRFVKDTSKFWYKPNITREEAIQLLKDRAPGTFVVRDSNSFPGAFGLALKVSQIPANVQTKSSGDPSADLVRHFLIEPTPKGVRLRGCSNEPVFGSLASLVYQHSITPLALPCKLVLPEAGEWNSGSKVTASNMASQTVIQNQLVGMDTMDSTTTSEVPSSAAALLAQGAACNVLFLNSIDTESLTGPQAVSRAVKMTLESQQPKTTVVHFKVSNQGITLTDNQRKLFFRRHYPVSAVTYCGMDPEQRKFRREVDGQILEARLFGFVARKQGGVSDNACHLFAELDPEQPASAIVNFVTKIMIGQSKIKLKS